MSARALLAALLLLAAPTARTATSFFETVDDYFQGNAVDLLGTADSDHFYSARVRGGVLLRERSPYDFTGVGVGLRSYKQHDWSTDGWGLVGALRNVDRDTGAGVTAALGIGEISDHVRLVGDATWNARLSRSTGFELIGQREYVETRAGLEAGTMTNFFAASIDHAASERLTLIGLGGVQLYSDNNWRPHLRGRAIYALMPEQGLSVQARARWYESNRTAPATYFNPERYAQADLGLRLRRSLGQHWRVLAAAGAGEEDVEGGETKRTYYVEARGERSFGKDLWLALSYVLDRSSGSDGASGDYTWHYLRAVLLIPF